MSAALLAFLAVGATATGAQPCSRTSGPRVAALAAGLVAAEAAAITIRHSDWWEPPRRSFHFIWSGSPSKGQDGMLHMAIAYQASQLATLGWDWACISHKTAGWLGAITGIAVGIPKEVGDGFHQNGFSGPDMLWTSAGALLPALHRQWPATRAVALKVFYWPSDEYRHRVAGGIPTLENDYAGQRYLLSLNPGRTPGGAGGWPDWLGVAVGHGVPTWSTIPPQHDWYLTLDLELRGLPIRGKPWHTIATLLDQVHFPMPGVRLRNGEWAIGMF